MIKAYRENNTKNSFLCIEGIGKSDKNTVDSLEINMLVQNEITGFCNLYVREEDQKQQFVYNVTGMTSLKNKYSNKEMGKDDIKNLIIAIKKAFENIEEYLLDKDHLLLEPEYIFIETVGCGIGFCYYPYSDMTLRESIRSLAEFLISVTNHSQEEAVNLSYGFYSQVSLEDYHFDRLFPDKENEGEKSEKVPEDRNILAEREIYRPDERRLTNVKSDQEYRGPGHKVLTAVITVMTIVCLTIVLLLFKLG